MNLGKTEITRLQKSTVHTTDTKKLGSKISDVHEIKWRINKATDAYRLMNKLWLDRTNVSLKSKVRMYSACIKPILTYLTSTLATTATQLKKLNTTHTKHLRYLTNIHYPHTIANETLYHVTKQRSITLDITNARWKLFGHILRQDPNTITNVVMTKYFENTTHPKLKTTRLPTSLPIQLNRDLVNIKQNLTLKNSKDLQHLKHLAQNRNTWDLVVAAVMKSATEIEKQKFEKKRKKREEVELVYETNGIRKKVTLTCRTPQDQLYPDEYIGPTNRKRRRSHNNQQNHSINELTTTQRRRAIYTELIDIHHLRSI